MEEIKLYQKFRNLFRFGLLLMFAGCISPSPPVSQPLTAKYYYSGFDLANNTYNAIASASDGMIYYILSSKSIEEGGKMYVYNPESDQIKFLANLTEICGEKGLKTVPQGKCHSDFYESKGKLYFSTHCGYYNIIDGMERMAKNLPKGYSPYPGGHFLSYDLSTGRFKDLGIASKEEGILTMTMDTLRNQLYAITWPKGQFIHFDLNTNQLKNMGQISAEGETGQLGKDYRVLCRSFLVDPRDGKVYYSTAEGDIFYYDPTNQLIQQLKEVSLKMDYLGKYDPTLPGSMAYNWRKIFWYPQEKIAYGVHGNSGYLFRFDPDIPSIDLVERITSEPSQKSGMYDQFSYGYLGFELGPSHETIYYLTGGPIYEDGRRVEGVEKIGLGGVRGLENLHLITYNIPNKRYLDHGPIFYSDGQRPTWVNSIAIGEDGYVYTLARFKHNDNLIEDLTKISDPFSSK